MDCFAKLKTHLFFVLLSLATSCGALDPDAPDLELGDKWKGGYIFQLNVDGESGKVCALTDNSGSLVWEQGGPTSIGPGAQSTSDGEANTLEIVSELGASVNHAAGLCDAFEIDSEDNTPCDIGNDCYDNWYLPASFEMADLSLQSTQRGGPIVGFTIANYQTSTEDDANNAFVTTLNTGALVSESKAIPARVRCVREF